MGKVFILRHGETKYNRDKRLQGHCDSPLTERGITQAAHAGTALKEHLDSHESIVYTSTLGRALQSADTICRKAGIAQEKLIHEPRLREFSLGEWERQSIPSIRSTLPRPPKDKEWYLKAPGAESYDSVRIRLESWLSELPTEKDVVAITHGLTSAVLRGILLDLSYNEIWLQEIPQNAFFIIENGSIRRIACSS